MSETFVTYTREDIARLCYEAQKAALIVLGITTELVRKDGNNPYIQIHAPLKNCTVVLQTTMTHNGKICPPGERPFRIYTIGKERSTNVRRRKGEEVPIHTGVENTSKRAIAKFLAAIEKFSGRRCDICGEPLLQTHRYCPNCGC